MHSFSLFLHCHLPEVGISGLWFSAKVESKQSIKVSVITERKGQNVWEVSALIFHFSHSVSYFLFFFSFLYFSSFQGFSNLAHRDLDKPFHHDKSLSVLPSRKIGCAHRSTLCVLQTKKIRLLKP